MTILLTLLRQFWWVPVAAGLYFYGDYHGTEAQKLLHTAYVAERDLAEAQALKAAQDASQAAYDALAAKYRKATDDYTTAKAAADARAADADARMRDYQNRLRASATKGPTTPTGDPGPEIVRFRLTDSQRFADTALDVAKNAEADATSLQACRAALGE